jgi:hypothetical protein
MLSGWLSFQILGFFLGRACMRVTIQGRLRTMKIQMIGLSQSGISRLWKFERRSVKPDFDNLVPEYLY